ncbi:MAG: DUF58 domain-containing protein [Thermogemmata sp.]|jgi:uncharacterized protein (DUF58 family)|uniref:DUF58 domain-containing protein n=1 Tax=Thermogemmata fonticola TaxID=2755323 RepID=A0A7V8VFN2_9BACT|nr:DUF58 domain-containing protein [Thermogemmata fonticola]MBA2227164.1 DUF58 domain-containing protein [Thermogemmata fonticola]MCX8140376.1 DUF58 domain-containing protein [Gemmataceae bacterium]
MTAEKYLRPEVIRQVGRLDLRAKFIVEGFLSGLHASPFHGFSVEFSEHRKYNPGDDIKTIDWNVYAKTGKYFVKKYRAETNVTGWLVMDLSQSMDWNGPLEARSAGVKVDASVLGAAATETLTKFEYGICLAAALGYLMIQQQDPVGLVAFDTQLRTVVPPKSKRTQLGTLLSVLANLRPSGPTDIAGSLMQLAAFVRGKSLIMLFSDLLPTRDDWRSEAEAVIRSLYRLRYAGHEVIVFHILDVLEAQFPLAGLIDFADVESEAHQEVDAQGIREDYLRFVEEFRGYYQRECAAARVDYVPIDTSVGFDRALLDYLILRQQRFG